MELLNSELSYHFEMNCWLIRYYLFSVFDPLSVSSQNDMTMHRCSFIIVELGKTYTNQLNVFDDKILSIILIKLNAIDILSMKMKQIQIAKRKKRTKRELCARWQLVDIGQRFNRSIMFMMWTRSISWLITLLKLCQKILPHVHHHIHHLT